jgi:hypothetical protein
MINKPKESNVVPFAFSLRNAGIKPDYLQEMKQSRAKKEEEADMFENRIMQAYKDTRHQIHTGLHLALVQCHRDPVTS